MPEPHHLVFLQAGCPSCRPVNSVKALKAQAQVMSLSLVDCFQSLTCYGQYKLDPNAGNSHFTVVKLFAVKASSTTVLLQSR